MPDSEIVAHLKNQFPGTPIITFNSDEDFAIKSYHYPTDTEGSTDNFRGDITHSQESNDCRHCGKAASLVCGACKGLPTGEGDSKMNTRFCSTTCQKAVWRTHKTECKAAKHRHLLYRAAGVTKALLYIHQRTTFTWGYFDNVERHGPIRVVILDRAKSDTRKTMLVPFSTVTELVPDQGEQEAFLTHLSCTQAIVNFGLMLAEMIKGSAFLGDPVLHSSFWSSHSIEITSSIEEVTLLPKNTRLEILQGLIVDGQRAARKDGWKHVVFKVTLKNDDQYAIDLTGAQHGHHQECMKWDEYVASRVETIISTPAFGSTKQVRIEQTMKKGPPYMAVIELNDFFANELWLAVRDWACRNGSSDGSLDRLLALPGKEYEQGKESLLSKVRKVMETSRANSIRAGKWCIR